MKQVLSMLMTFTMLITGCGGGQGAGSSGQTPAPTPTPTPAARTLAQPVYPEFPQQPKQPEEGDEAEWDAYSAAYDEYRDALLAIRGENPGLTQAEEDALNAFAAKSTSLAIKGHEGENAVYSPLSLWSALAMLAQCAGGDSRQQALDALEVDGVDTLQEAVSRIWKALYTDDGNSSLLLANSIWLNDSAQGTYVQDTLDTMAQKHFAGVYSVPMGTSEADKAVTDWVSEQTHGLIGGDAPVVRTQPETLALLASSLYYRAGWRDEFSPDRTEKDIFTDAAGDESKVDFMHKTQDGSFLRRDGYQAAALGTRLGEMVFVLPDAGVTPESLLQDPQFLTGLDLHGDDSIWGEVQWSVPKFDVDSDLNLLDTLKSLGVTDLLEGGKADLSALTDLDAYLSDAKQLARVKVDEEGVEAAAVTMMMVEATSAMPDPDPEICVMDLDRPFLFVIRTQETILFVGVVNQV